ncbi:MAG TPA: DUF975 family protein [Candidatus Jeotgalibaca pullicola]|nr:DUF975 family protein [Candidatus Jeotgalibaca pullicola]
MRSNKEIRLIGRENLRGNYLISIGNMFLISFFSFLVQSLLSRLFGVPGLPLDYTSSYMPAGGEWRQTIVTLIVSFISALLALGFTWGFLDIQDGERMTVGHLFLPFKENFLKAVGFSFLKQLLIVLWTLLFIIPGILKSYSWAMAEYVFYDHRDLPNKMILDESEQLMRGNRWKLFKLDFYYFIFYFIPVAIFIGGILYFMFVGGNEPSYGFALLAWLLLAYVAVIVFTLVCAFIIEPRRNSAHAAFYLELVERESNELEI